MELLLITLAEDDKAPEAKDVVAGWTGFAVFLVLIAAVALLCWSMIRQLRKTQRAKEAGVFGDEPTASPNSDGTTGDTHPDGAPSDGAPSDGAPSDQGESDDAAPEATSGAGDRLGEQPPRDA